MGRFEYLAMVGSTLFVVTIIAMLVIAFGYAIYVSIVSNEKTTAFCLEHGFDNVKHFPGNTEGYCWKTDSNTVQRKDFLCTFSSDFFPSMEECLFIETKRGD